MSTFPAASAKGVVVMNTPFGNSITTAEHAIALMFALARDLPAADASTQAGKWEKNRFMGVELTSKTLGLIGAGNIGSIVADRALGLRMKVVAYDPFLTPERALDLGIEKVELWTSCSPAPISSPCTRRSPTRPATSSAASNLAKTKKGVRIINCARGGLIDEAALKEALESGHVAGAALDVFVEEPAKRQSPVRHARLRRDAASRRLDDRGAGQCRDPGRRADVGIPDPRRSHQRAQHAVALGRGGAEAAALYGACRKARLAGRAARGAPRTRRSRSRSKAPPPRSTRSRSPARCWPA